MSLIYLPGSLPATFADDHYRDDPTEEITVVAHVPDWADIRWYHDLLRRHDGRRSREHRHGEASKPEEHAICHLRNGRFQAGYRT